MATIQQIANYLESIAPLNLQEDYDNSGLLVGDSSKEVEGILVTLDITEDVIEEAIKNGDNLIVAHHPIIFRGLKRLTGNNYVQRSVIKAIKNDIAIYAIHTNLDNVPNGVNKKISDKLGLIKTRILRPGKEKLLKIVTFIPEENTKEVLDKVHELGAGQIGDYDHCSFRVGGTGRFKGNEDSDPAIGSKGNIEEVKENRVEFILSEHLKNYVINTLKSSHPYEEVAYYIQSLDNIDNTSGSGMIGQLENEMDSNEFMDMVKSSFHLSVLKHTEIISNKIKKVAVCGGSGSFLIKDAIRKKADVFISADIKYHDFFDAEKKIMIMDIGHYESEVFTKELLGDLLSKKFTTFAVRLAETITNPVFYY